MEETGSSSVHTSRMNAEQFSGSLFELIDMWTSSVDAAEYVEFALDLQSKIAPGGVEGGGLVPVDKEAARLEKEEREKTGWGSW